MYDLIIIGAGAAGSAAAIYALSRDLKTLVIEKEKIGGLIGKISIVTHYPGIIEGESGEDFAKRIEIQLQNAGAKVKYENVLETKLIGDIKKVRTDKNEYEAKAVIIATGTEENRLNVPGELEYENIFVSHEVSKFKDKVRGGEAIVVGGSDGALKEALYLSKIAHKVYVVHHGEKIAAISDFQRKVEAYGNIEYVLNSEVVGFQIAQRENVALIKNNLTGTIKKFINENLYVFIYIGSKPNSEIYKELELNNGYIVTDKDMKTSIKGVFSAGNVIDKKVRQVSTAVSEGTIAALSANSYIKEN